MGEVELELDDVVELESDEDVDWDEGVEFGSGAGWVSSMMGILPLQKCI